MSRKPLAVASNDSLKSGQQAHNTIPGLFIQEDKNKKKKSELKKKKDESSMFMIIYLKIIVFKINYS